MSETLAAALAALQTKLPPIKKSETAQVRSEKGSYSYSYANLADISAQIMPLLGEVGLSFSARPTLNEAREFVLAYELLHTSGENRCGEYPLPSGGTPQALGSAITYGRRYVLCALTGVAPEDDDDDAQAAQASARQPQQRRGPQPEARDEPTAETSEWIAGFEQRVKDAADADAVMELKREITEAQKNRQIKPGQAVELRGLCNQKIEALEGAE